MAAELTDLGNIDDFNESKAASASLKPKELKSPVEKMRVRLAAEGYDSGYTPMEGNEEQGKSG